MNKQNKQVCKNILNNLKAIGYRIDEIRHMVQYINDSHKPFNKSLDEISRELEQKSDSLSNIRIMVKKYMAEEGLIGEHASMAIVGTFETGFSLYVHNNDNGDRPHFHMRKNDINVCIELERPEYFRQGDAHESGVLDEEEKQDLIELFQTVVDIEKFKKAGITVWDMMCITWNWNNPDNEVSDDLEMPDYSKLS